MDDPVYWATCSSGDLPEHDAWLGSMEREQLATLRFPKRRHDWRLGRWTAKRAVLSALRALGSHDVAALDIAVPAMDDVQILAAADGAPEPLLNATEAGSHDVVLSLSHSADRGFAAASATPMALGCDVERIEPRSEAFIADFFAADELPGLNDLSQRFHRDLAATLIWSAKESALKALRTGLRDDTRSVVVDVDVSRGELSVLSAIGELKGWWWTDEGFVHTLVSDCKRVKKVQVGAGAIQAGADR
jgi:4'-phosphopantetheinyl transferase